nr:unnamed protein product [Callosobruchus analis]
MRLVLWISQLFLGTLSSAELQLDVVNQWNYLNFDLPYRFAYASEIRLENTVFTGLEVSEDRIFIATPRLRAGVPATLSTIPRHAPPGSGPTLSAYPSWQMHGPMRGNVNCSQLISVYRMKMDSCHRLWVGARNIEINNKCH